jgi:hypothetical protein
MSELRITDTNSANDSKGRAFGLEGNDFLYVLIGLVAALGLYLGLSVLLHVSLEIAVLVALPVVIVPAAWVLLLRHNKPAGYAGDWFDERVKGDGWSFVSHVQPKPPGKGRNA